VVEDEAVGFGALVVQFPVDELHEVVHGVPGVVVVELSFGDESGAIQEEVAGG
jgi:hypothetical protein